MNPPESLSRLARREWCRQLRALEAAGRATPARVSLITRWAESLDARDRARAAWEEAGSPTVARGSTGQERRHSLATALDRAEERLAMLTARVERSVARKGRELPPVPTDAIEVNGHVLQGGRLLVRSVRDGRWVLDADEEEHSAGWVLRWVGPDGVPVFHACPPLRLDGEPWTLDDARRWARRQGVPIEAVEAWVERQPLR